MKRKSRHQLLLAISSLGVGNLGSSIFIFCLSLYVLQKTKSSLIFSIILLIQPLINLLLSPLVGYFVDKYDHKKICVLSQITSIGLDLTFILLFIQFSMLSFQLWFIGIITINLAICDNFQATAYKASTMQMVVEDHRQQLVAYEQFISASVSILTPILGGIVYSIFSINMIGIVGFSGEVIALFLLLFLNFKLVKIGTNSLENITSIKKSFSEGLKYIFHNKKLISLLYFAIFANFALGAIEVGLPVIMINSLKISSKIYGLTDSFLAVGMLIMSIVITSINIRNYLKFTGYLGLLLTSLFIIFATFSLSKNIYLIVSVFSICMFGIGTILAAANLPYAMYVRTKIPENKQGRVGATTSAIVSVLSPISYIFFGMTFSYISPIWNFLLCAGLILLDSVYLLKVNHNATH